MEEWDEEMKRWRRGEGIDRKMKAISRKRRNTKRKKEEEMVR